MRKKSLSLIHRATKLLQRCALAVKSHVFTVFLEVRKQAEGASVFDDRTDRAPPDRIFRAVVWRRNSSAASLRAVMSEIDGIVQITRTGDQRMIMVTNTESFSEEYEVPEDDAGDPVPGGDLAGGLAKREQTEHLMLADRESSGGCARGVGAGGGKLIEQGFKLAGQRRRGHSFG